MGMATDPNDPFDIEFMTFDRGGDLQTLLCVEMRTIPRVGDTVNLSGPRFGVQDELRCYQNSSLALESSRFVVKDVTWDIDETGCHGVKVFCDLPCQDVRAFVPYCTCEADRRKPSDHDPSVCDDCNGYIRGVLAPR